MADRNGDTTQLVVSSVGLGCNNFSRPGTATESQAGTTAVVHAALDAGITLFDTAALYGTPAGMSEQMMGVALQGRRDEAVVATKFGHRGGGPAGYEAWGPRGAATYVRRAVEGSLQRLQTDRIDLFQIHTPDPETPIGETLSALSELVDEGKVLFVGNSNFSTDQLREAESVASDLGVPRFVTAQNEYSLLNRHIEKDVLPTAVELGMGVLPFFPLFNGLLTGKYTRAGGGSGRLTRIKPEVLEGVDWDQLEAYQALCDDAGVSMLGASFAWLLARPGIASVIAGATTPEQVQQNTAAGDTRLGDDVLAAITDLFARR